MPSTHDHQVETVAHLVVGDSPRVPSGRTHIHAARATRVDTARELRTRGTCCANELEPATKQRHPRLTQPPHRRARHALSTLIDERWLGTDAPLYRGGRRKQDHRS
jgi:hypothetical protein